MTPAHDAEAVQISVESGSVTIIGDRWGSPGDSAPIVMLHGGGQTRHSWDRSAKALAEHGR